MITSYKRLGATEVVADTNTLLYTVPELTSAIVSTLIVCNAGVTARTFRVAIIQGGIDSLSLKDYIYYDVPIPAKETFLATTGFTLATGDTIMVRANHAEVVFSCFGSEIS